MLVALAVSFLLAFVVTLVSALIYVAMRFVSRLERVERVEWVHSSMVGTNLVHSQLM